jgi:DNA-binding PadR family transcriptional regulator
MWEEEIRQHISQVRNAVIWAGQQGCAEFLWAAGGSRPESGGSSDGGGRSSSSGGGGGGFPPFPPFGPWGSFPWSFFRRPRAKRGDVRAAILTLLSEKSLNGYQIMQELEQRSRGSWRPSPGAVYPALQQLEDEGLVRAESSGSGRVYSLTEAGRRYVREHADEFAAPWETGSHPTCDDSVLGLFAEIKHIATATLQVVHAGSPNQTREAQKILNQARRSLYRLLADDLAEDESE